MPTPQEDPAALLAPAEVIEKAVEAFVTEFGRQADVAAAAPGRVNLIGEHTDYNDGFVLPIAIERWTAVAGRGAEGETTTIAAVDLEFDRGTFRADAGFERVEPRWLNYPKGVRDQFVKHGIAVPAFEAAVTSTVPNAAGLSSSAAIEVATATFLEHLLKRKIDPREKALWCQKAEHEAAGVPCGIMDQFISALGRKDHALLIDCRSLETRQVPLDDPGVAVVIANSQVKHDLANEYAERRAACEEAARALGVPALRDASPEDLERVRGELPDAVYRRARHVVTENARTLEAAEALAGRDYARFGRLMNEAHASYRDDFEASCREVELLVALAQGFGGVLGSRLTGGGFGGCTVTLVEAERAPALIEHLDREYAAKTGKHPRAFVTRAADGAAGMP